MHQTGLQPCYIHHIHSKNRNVCNTFLDTLQTISKILLTHCFIATIIDIFPLVIYI